ncbi:F-box family protein [Euphorbia peplus]|nr:F-box family protein [Euphorbia peplus]
MRNSNFPAEIVGRNNDLLTDIMLRLPAKPLVRFKSVSKQWLSLISSSQFSSLHTRRNPNFTISGLIYRSSPSKITLLPLSSSSSSSRLDSFNTHGIKILQSCNGLLLCCSSTPDTGVLISYYISNPTTNQLFTLPSCSSSSFAIFTFNLAFDPSKSTHYKVICLRSTASSLFHNQILIYESQTGAWRLSGSPFRTFDVDLDNGVFWNGSVHWISRAQSTTLRFDVCREQLGRFPDVPSVDRMMRTKCRYFGESCGHLYVIEAYESTQFKVLEMNRDYSSWSVRFNVDLGVVINEFPEMVSDFWGRSCYDFRVLSVVDEENEEESSSILLRIPGKVVSYNVKSNAFRIVNDFEGGSSYSFEFGLLHVYPYIETLAPVC